MVKVAALLLLSADACSAYLSGDLARPAVVAKPSFARAAVAPSMIAEKTVALPTGEEMVLDDAECIRPGGRGVPLTGETLKASMKMRCDMTGAAYAIYWVRHNDDLKPAASYVSSKFLDGAAQGYVDGSLGLTLDANGNGPIAVVKREQGQDFVENTQESSMVRRELAFRFGVSQVGFIAFEDGVLEFGNSADAKQWDELPTAQTMPKGVMRKAFEELGALYAMYWKNDPETGEMKVVADYENPRDATRRKQLRSDGESFITISEALTLSSRGNGPVARALNEQEEVVVVFADGVEDEACNSMKRKDAAKEFGVCSIHFVPCGDGVFEFGVSAIATLNENTKKALLEMQAEAVGAGYSIYWKQNGDKMVFDGSFTSNAYLQEARSAGKRFSFADASEGSSFPLAGDSPIAQVMKKRKPVYVQDIQQSEGETRKAIATDYRVASVVYVPVLGGVIEYGTSLGDSTATWNSAADALAQKIPNEELEMAFKNGATYAIYWKRNDELGIYQDRGDFEVASNTLSAAAAAKGSFTKASSEAKPVVGGLGPIAIADTSVSTIQVADTQNFPAFKRKELAAEWGVGKITCVPLETGVLEYGSVTKDKRSTTSGAEFQEAQREYRRTVFMHDDWVKHRSTDRFKRSMQTIFESGILKARYNEIQIVAAFASFLVVYNSLAAGYTDFDMIKHGAVIPHLPTLSIPLSIFSLTAPSLGLLLVFRTNTCYARWDDARKIWGDIINKCRSLGRQSNTFILDDRYPGYGNFRDYRRRFAAETNAFTRCLRCFLRGPSDRQNLAVELKDLGFTPEEVAGYMGATNQQAYALAMLGQTIRSAQLDGRDRARMDDTLSKLTDDIGACERIFKSPIPLIYTRHTSRFVGVWLALLPLAIWGVDPSWNHLITIPSCSVICYFLLGIEELGLQIEEPYSILPMEAFCDGSIGAVLNEMVLAEDKQRAMEIKLTLDAAAGMEKNMLESTPARTLQPTMSADDKA